MKGICLVNEVNNEKDDGNCIKRQCKRKFSREEDSMLIWYINEFHDKDFSDIGRYLFNRKPAQARERYNNYLKPGVDHSPFSVEEIVKIG
jgi:hypothetical protein